MTDATVGTETTLSITRTLSAPRELVFRAWTDPDMLRQWWGMSADYSTPIAEVDLRVGGKYRLGMQAPDHQHPFVVGGTFREVSPPEKLVYTWVWEHFGEDDASGSAEEAGSPPDAVETVVTVEFRDLQGSTEIVLTHQNFADRNMRDEHSQGWNGALDQLAQLVEGG